MVSVQILKVCLFISFMVLFGCQMNSKEYPQTNSQEYNGKIAEDGRGASLETKQKKFLEYNGRGAGGYYYNSLPADRPRKLAYSIVDYPKVVDQMRDTSLISYMVVENDFVVIDSTSPPERFGKVLEASPFLYSMSFGKTLTGYLVGHAICQGYIDSVDQQLSDWPLVKETFMAEASVRDLLNATMGHQKFLKNNEEFHSGRFVDGTLRGMISTENLRGSTPGQKRHAYGQLPAFVALNYVAFKTGHNFREFSNEVLQNHVGLSNPLKWAHRGGSRYETSGNIHPNFNAIRDDTLRIGMAILEDWNKDNCLGRYLKDVYANRVKKSFTQRKNTGWGKAGAYAGFFHTDYRGISDTVMGMDGYGGLSMLINFDKNRIVYAHAVARDYDHQKLIFDVISQGL